jgi:IS5 family transposase
MNRNSLIGQVGDKINAVLAAAGYNLRKLLRWLVHALNYWLGWLLAER